MSQDYSFIYGLDKTEINRTIVSAYFREEDVVFTRWNKVWVVLTLFSALGWTLYWLPSATENFIGALGLSLQDLLNIRFLSYTLPVWSGELLRCLGFSLALFSAYIVWGPSHKSFSSVRKYVAFALLFEAIYLLCLMPTNVVRIIDGDSPFFLYFAFILQVLLISPFLMFFSLKVWRYQETATTSLLRWSSVIAISYLIGLWIKNVFRWLSMSESAGLGFILSGIISIGFLNSIVTLSLSLVFAVIGLYITSKKKQRALSQKLLAFALVTLGLHFVIFIVYSVIVDALKWVLLVEIWPIMLLGLGLSRLAIKSEGLVHGSPESEN